jgi:hypothetical protein
MSTLAFAPSIGGNPLVIAPAFELDATANFPCRGGDVPDHRVLAVHCLPVLTGFAGNIPERIDETRPIPQIRRCRPMARREMIMADDGRRTEKQICV